MSPPLPIHFYLPRPREAPRNAWLLVAAALLVAGLAFGLSFAPPAPGAAVAALYED